MKKLLPLFLAGSLALNAALAFYTLRASSTAADGPSGPPTTSRAPMRTSSEPAGPAQLADVAPSLATKQLPALVEELRAAGFPPEVVRAMAGTLLSEQFAARRKALDPNAEKRPFWKDVNSDPKYQQAQTLLWLEERRALRALLGAEAESDPYTLARSRQQFGNLPPEKLAQVMDLARNFEDKKQEIYSSGVYSKDERDKITALEKQQRAAMSQLLTPAELEEYDLRNSNTGRALRSDLLAFNPTEEEFRTIFKFRQAYDEQWSNSDNGLPNQAEGERRNAAYKEMNERIKAALGPVRGPDYEITSDYNYRRVSQVVSRLELPPETTRQLWEAQKEFQQRATAIRRAATNPEERATQLTALQQEASTKLTGMLGGDRGLEAYRQYGGTWLNNMVPRPAPAKKN